MQVICSLLLIFTNGAYKTILDEFLHFTPSFDDRDVNALDMVVFVSGLQLIVLKAMEFPSLIALIWSCCPNICNRRRRRITIGQCNMYMSR